MGDDEVMGRTLNFEVVYDDSESQTDYYAPDRPLFRYPYEAIGERERVTEQLLRASLAKLPAWARGLPWAFKKGEKYSMSDHYYGQLRCDHGLEGVPDWPFAYAGRGYQGRTLTYLVKVGYEDINCMNHADGAIPQSVEELARRVEAKRLEQAELERTMKDRMVIANVKAIQSSSAVIDGRGFHVLTEAEKLAEVKKTLQTVENWQPIIEHEHRVKRDTLDGYLGAEV